MIKMSTNRDWLLKKAKAEDECAPYAAGLAYELGFINTVTGEDIVASLALARLIGLWRRQHHVSSAQLAERIGITAEQLLLLELGEGWSPDGEILRRLARAMHLQEDKLLQLFGFSAARDTAIHEAVVRFMEQSEESRKLSATEKDALDQITRCLS